MRDTRSLGTWIQRFLLEHLVQDRNLSLNTQRSYRDTLVLLLTFLTRKLRKAAAPTSLDDLSEGVVRLFLLDLEKSRHCEIRTRNHRLSALRSLTRFIGMRNPEYLAWSGKIRDIPLKRSVEPLTPYLKNPKCKRSSASQTFRRARATATMPSCFSFTTPAAGQTRWHN